MYGIILTSQLMDKWDTQLTLHSGILWTQNWNLKRGTRCSVVSYTEPQSIHGNVPLQAEGYFDVDIARFFGLWAYIWTNYKRVQRLSSMWTTYNISQVKNTQENVYYNCHRWYLQEDHYFRGAAATFDGEANHKMAAKPLTGNQTIWHGYQSEAYIDGGGTEKDDKFLAKEHGVKRVSALY